MFRKLLIGLIVFLGISLAPAAAQSSGDSAWDAATELYKADELDAALKALEEFRKQFPDDPKADDAIWFIGRIHVKAGRAVEAEQAFRSLMALPFRSNRYTEAVYDLAKLSASQGEVNEAIDLLESVQKSRNLKSEDRRVLRLLAGLEADQAGQERRDYRDAEALAGWQRSMALYELLLAGPDDDKGRQDDLTEVGKTWAVVSAAAGDRGAHEAARGKALTALRQARLIAPAGPSAARLDARIDELEKGDPARIIGTAEAFGGGAPSSAPTSTYTQWGGIVSADMTFVLPLGWEQELRLGLSADHDSFSLKTSNFTAAEQAGGAVRIVQRTNDLGASVGWHAGSRHGLHSELEVAGQYSPAEDLGDTSYGLSADERLDLRLGPAWKLGLDLGFAWEAWPDDLAAMTRELDRWEASTNPKMTWYPHPDFRVDAGYSFTFRQYLNSVYAPDTLSKQLFVHGADLGVRWTPGSVARLSLDYALTLNDTNRYTVTVFGPGAVTVADYYDYVGHALTLGADLRWSEDLRTSLGGSVSYRAFANYPARDASMTFTGATRADWHFGVDAEAAWRFSSAKVNRVADLWAVAAVTYDRNASNSAWEDSIQTNYTVLTLYTGLRLTLP